MGKIKLLKKEIWDKIAAGEVIESPLSVVKELVENAIDSGASKIVIEIKNGGKDYIRVSDNGCGISAEDLALSVVTHATSKIEEISDLDNIMTLGFRGEALPSIAAVSTMEILSKTEDSKKGRQLVCRAGEVIEEGDYACDDGTTVIAKDLFFNLPARRKFLRSDTKESTSVSDFVSKIALAYPCVQIRFISNGNILFSTPGKGDIYQTILTVYSPQNARKLLKLAAFEDGMKISGYVSSPLESNSNKRHQIFFVNGRLISSNVLENAVSFAYRDKLFEGRFPSIYMFLEISPSMIDVNVHPRKSEVKFYSEESVYNFVVKSIRDALLDKDATVIDKEDVDKKQLSTYINNETSIASPVYFEDEKELPVNSLSDNKDILFGSLRKEAANERTEEKDIAYANFEDAAAGTIEEITFAPQKQISFEENTVERKLLFSSLTPISQVFTTYILASDVDSFYIIDQHAAHERIMYEKFLKLFNDDSEESQLLLIPFVIELDKTQMISAAESIEILSKLGFAIEEFGESSFIVREIPYFLDGSESEDFLNEFFNTADEFKSSLQLRKDQIISRSCKAAVKAHDRLGLQEMNSLFCQLDQCENPYSCPHGRPTFIKFTEYELEKLFRRK